MQKVVVSGIKMRVVILIGIKGYRSRDSVCSSILATIERQEVQKSEWSDLNNVRSVSEVSLVERG